MSLKNNILVWGIVLAVLACQVDADGCLAYSGNNGQYWLVCTPQSISGAQSKCGSFKLPVAKFNNDPSFNFSSVLHALKYRSSMPNQVEEYFKIFATSYSVRLNHWFNVSDQLANHIVSQYGQSTRDVITFFNNYHNGLSDPAQKAQVVSLNSSILNTLRIELIDMLNEIATLKTNMRNEVNPIILSLQTNCETNKNDMLSDEPSKYKDYIGTYLSTLEGSTAKIKTAQGRVTGTIYPSFSSSSGAITSTETTFNTAANNITIINSSFNQLKTDVQGVFTSLISSIRSRHSTLSSSLSAPSIDDIETRLKSSASEMNKDYTL